MTNNRSYIIKIKINEIEDRNIINVLENLEEAFNINKEISIKL